MSDSDKNKGEKQTDDTNEEPQPWYLQLRGLMTDEEVDEFIRHIYAERQKDKGRPPPDLD